MNSCLVPVAQVSGSTIQTIEGIASEDQLHAVQQALLNVAARSAASAPREWFWRQ